MCSIASCCFFSEISGAPSRLDLSSWVLTLAAGSDLVLLRGQGRGEAGMGREGKAQGAASSVPLKPHARALQRSGRFLPALCCSLAVPPHGSPLWPDDEGGTGATCRAAAPAPASRGEAAQAGRRLGSLTRSPACCSISGAASSSTFSSGREGMYGVKSSTRSRSECCPLC